MRSNKPTHKVAGTAKARSPRIPSLPRAVRAEAPKSEVDKAFDTMYVGHRQYFRQHNGLSWEKYLQHRKATWEGIMAILDDFIVQLKAQVQMEEKFAADLAAFKLRSDFGNLNSENKFLFAEDQRVNAADLKAFKQALERAEASVREIKNLSF